MAHTAVLLLLGVGVGAGVMVLLQPVPSSVAPTHPAPLRDDVIPVREMSANPSTLDPDLRPASAPHLSGASALEDLDPRPEDWTFLREALLRERERREAARMDPSLGGLEVLRRVAEYRLDPMSVLGSYAAFRARVRVEGSSRTIEQPRDEAPVRLGDGTKDTAIIEFGPGTFILDRNSQEWMSVREGTRSLEIRGAGMDKTILTGSLSNCFHVWADAAFENLIVRDLTLDGGDRGVMLLDVRGRLSAALENVRVRGWTSGGHSSPIGISGSAILGARGCEFLGARGGGLFVLSVRGPSLAVFESCLFSNVSEAVVGPGGSGEAGSAVHLIDCAYENSAVVSSRMERGKGKTAFPVAVKGGTVALGPEDLPDEKRRALWGAPFLASMEGVTFAHGKPSCTLGDLLAVLDRVVFDSTEAVYGVKHLGPGLDGSPRFGIRFLNRSSSSRGWRVVGSDGSLVEKPPADRGGGWNAPTPVALETRGLAQAIRISEIPHSAAADEVALSAVGSGEGETLGLYVRTSMSGWPSWTADATSGKVLNKD
jgi:hypothetical protein